MSAAAAKANDRLSGLLHGAMQAHEAGDARTLALNMGEACAVLFQAHLGQAMNEAWTAMLGDPNDPVSDFGEKLGEILAGTGCKLLSKRHLPALRDAVASVSAIAEIFERHHRKTGEKSNVMLVAVQQARDSLIALHEAVEPPAHPTTAIH